ncbi:MAG: TRAP transporter permease [Nitrospinota bacterium]
MRAFESILNPLLKLASQGARTPRTLTGPLYWSEVAAASLLSGWYLYTAYFGFVSEETNRGLLILLTVVLVLLRYGARAGSPARRPSIWDWVLMLAGGTAVIYWMIQYQEMSYRLGEVPTWDIVIFGLILTVVSLEVARRVTGPIIPGICLLFFIYNFEFVGPYLPTTLLEHGGHSLGRTMEYLYGPSGILGLVTEVFATYVVVFVVLGAFLEKSGLGRLFIDLSFALTGRRTGGPGLAAVVSSSIFGMISGSAVSNVVTTGTFTIPLMKRVGYRPAFAAAVEAAASTGGTYMPPIMGAGAFLLAEFSEVSYLTVVKVAAVPAVIYFLSVGVMVYLEALKRNLRGVPKEEIPPWRSVVGRLHYLLPLPVVILFLFLGDDAFLAAFYAICTVVLVKVSEVVVRTFAAPQARLAVLGRGLWEVVRMSCESMVQGARSVLLISCIAGSLGILLGVADQTQLPLRFSEFLAQVAGENLALAVVLVIGAGYMVGMGLPITASYVILAIFAVPALTALGMSGLTAHFIAFWVATNSAVTPPVALAAYGGAAVAGADPVRTGFIATKLASWLYLMPFLFVYTPILNPDVPADYWWITFVCLVALVAWAAGLQGHFIRRTGLVTRLLFLGAALSLLNAVEWLGPAGLGAPFLPMSLKPFADALVPWSRAIGFGAFALALALQFRVVPGTTRAAAPAPAPAPRVE